MNILKSGYKIKLIGYKMAKKKKVVYQHCAFCGKRFRLNANNQKYCSVKCRFEATKHAARKRAKKWARENKERKKQTSHDYYLRTIDELQRKQKEYNRKNPHINKKAVEKWRKVHPNQDPTKYRIQGKLREKTVHAWGKVCPICGREFEDKGMLKRIVHHLQYEPEEHVVIICYQCHNLIHSRKCYGHPFVKLFGEESPLHLATAILKLYNEYLIVRRRTPRRKGGKRYKADEATVILNTEV